MNKQKRLKQDFPFLEFVANTSDKERKKILKTIDAHKCASILDCVYNCLNNKTLPTDFRKDTRARLENKKEKFRLLFDRKIPKDKKRKTLVQVGGDISHMLKYILPILADHLQNCEEQ